MDDIRRLIAIEDIKQLKARYFRGMDLKDRGLLESIFTKDAIADYRGATTDRRTGEAVVAATETVIEGRDAIVGLMIGAGKIANTVHHGSIPEIDIVDERHATGIWPMTDRLLFDGGSPAQELIGYGHYYEDYEQVDGSWKIRAIRLTRLRVDVIA